MRDLFLGGGPLLLGFSHFLIDRLLEGDSVPVIPRAELQGSLESCLANTPHQGSFPILSNFEGKRLFS